MRWSTTAAAGDAAPRLDYEAVRLVNPQIVYVGTFGFSQRGRYAARAPSTT